MNLTKYVQQNKVKLSTNEVRLLFNDIDTNKDIIIKSQLPLVLYLASNFSYKTGLPIEELFSIGLESLYKALTKYNNSSNASFTTFAKTCILTRFGTYEDGIIRIPYHQFKNEDNPKAHTFSSLNKNSIEDDSLIKIENNIADEVDETIDVDTNDLIKLINTTLKKTNHSYVVINYLGLGLKEKKTFQQIGNEVNLTHQRTQQIFSTSIDKLKRNKVFKMALKRLTDYEQ
ncbi:sigma factor [Pseudotamlana agarivorans]|uniref:sigma factor n=1 Tax=Pseudotamlana agarivorans TaxID=481183 RepID=UPI0008340B50|nr:sigma factor [Tamlana agarivorans]